VSVGDYVRDGATEPPAPRRAMGTPRDELQSRLIGLVRSSSMLMRALRAARTVDPPDWLIGAEAIRDRVWDHLHGSARPAPSKDIDLAFFDPCSLDGERERGVHSAVTAQAPDICWDVTNHAAVHLWYPQVFGVQVQPLRSCADAVGTWPETATAIGIRLMGDDSIRVVAPCGLDDLFALICRRNPRRATSEQYTSEQYRRRVQVKRIARRWPRVRVLDTPD
jgi:uncharacterized protein